MSFIKNIFISSESNYWKHPKGQPGSAPTSTPDEAQCHAGKGLLGDRFYEYKDNYGGQVSFMNEDALLELRKITGVEADFSVFRRNIIISQIDPLTLIGKRFCIGEVEFEGSSDCTPCAWMDYAAGEGAFRWLKENNKGGLRAKIVKSGTIHVGDELKII